MSVSEGIIMAKISGEILVVNAAAERISGFTLEELLNQNFNDIVKIINIHTREQVHDFIGQLVRTGESLTSVSDFALLQKNGSEVRISANIALIRDSEDKEVNVVVSFFDISEEDVKFFSYMTMG
jgi:PAS domain S-box-containing protein